MPSEAATEALRAGDRVVEGGLLGHLADSYRGVFPAGQLEHFVDEYLGIGEAEDLVRLVRSARPDAATLVDVGSGYGSFALLAAGEGLDVVAVELAAVEVDVSAERARSSGTDIRVVRGSAHDLPVRTESIDAVTLWNVAEHVPDLDAALREATRVLAPGGSLFVLAPNYASFRREAHYQVPWIPLLPKRLASAYLRRLGRDPRFLVEDVHYCTNRGVRRRLRANRLEVEDPRLAKLRSPETIETPRLRRAIELARRAGLAHLAALALTAVTANPLRRVIFVHARKAGR